MWPSRWPPAFAARLLYLLGRRAASPRRRTRRRRAPRAVRSRTISIGRARSCCCSIRRWRWLITGRAGAIKWIDNFGIQILIYIMLGWGLNIVVGLAGLLDLGYVAFYAVGAYAYALLPPAIPSRPSWPMVGRLRP